MNDDWMDELRGVDGALLPTAGVRAAVVEGVRRRRRRRAIGVGVGATGSVATVVAVVLLLPAALLPPDGESREPATSSTAPTSPELFDCPSQSDYFSFKPDPALEPAEKAKEPRLPLDAAAHDVERAIRGVPGFFASAFLRSEGAFLIQWKAPVPSQIQELAGLRPDGVRVKVEAVRYSREDAERGHRLVGDAFRRGQVAAEQSVGTICGDGTGIIVGVTPKTLGDRRAELQQQLTEIAGMPVKVVPEAQALAF